MSNNKNWAQHFASPETRVFVGRQSIPPTEFLSQDLLDPGGSADMHVNGSVTPVNFTYTVPAGHVFMLHRFVIQMVDGGIDWTGFGGLAALTNGIASTMYDDEGDTIMALANIYTTYDLSHFGGGSVDLRPGGGTAENLVASMDIDELIGYVLTFPAGYKIEVRIQDNLTGLDYLSGWVTGRLIPNGTV